MRKVFCATLGCDKNLVDSEALLGRFAIKGVQAVDDPEAADIWVLNTCGFIEAARSDSAETLRSLCDAKGERTLVVCGCWSQEHGDLIRERFPAVDVVAGVGQFDAVVAACTGTGSPARMTPTGTGVFPLAGPASPPIVGDPMTAPYVGIAERPLLTPAHVAFVKIGEGCNFSCSFCRIPLIRGKQRSRPIAEIAGEVRRLAGRGVTEIQLVSQNTSDFGRDSGENLYDLVRTLDGIDGLRRIRLFYLYSGVVTAGDLLRLLDLPKVVPYLDLPVQHASPRLLKAMRRPGLSRTSPDFFATLRRARPDVVLRSTALLGFPGEEDEDVAMLADFLAEVEFDHLGTYRYSPEPGTSSAELPDRVPEEVILDREALIQGIQEEIALERMEGRVGQEHEVLVDRILGPDELAAEGWLDLLDGFEDGAEAAGTLRQATLGTAPLAVGRSFHFGYDVDGSVIMPAGNLEPGRYVRGVFRKATATDVWAEEPAGEP
ncbi:MAG: MiaB/RimO family radical SAM methylthiotransferase [Candidatus Krumholzibacteriia bacterium]